MKIITIVGARPQFVKAATISRTLAGYPDIQEVLVHTGQHYDDEMSAVFFREMGIKEPEYNLGIGSGPHGEQTGRMIESIETILLKERPDWVLVYGDTNSTLAGAVSAAKLHIPVVHIEAGLRSFNKAMPEEINRILTDHASDLLFAPTQTAVENLANEGIRGERVRLIGDVMFDAAVYYASHAEKRRSILDTLKLGNRDYVLATIHRAENTDFTDRLLSIFKALIVISDKLPVVLPLHPRTNSQLQNCELFHEIQKKITIISPVGYLDMVMLEKNARAIVTDSGGIQKEAYFFDVPCVTARNETEWVELVEIGANVLVGSNTEGIINAVMNHTFPAIKDKNLYGEGNAAELAVEYLLQN